MRVFFIFTMVIALLALTSSFFSSEKLTFFSRNHTNLLKGLAILTVFWGHIGLAYHIHSLQWIAAIGVSLFLICSGYGLEASFKKNGLKHYWLKRFIAVIIPYWIVYILAISLINAKFNLKILFSVIFFTKANWYIPFILVIYIMYWGVKVLTIRFNLTEKTSYVLLFSVFTIWFVILSFFFIKPSAPSLLARQVYAFPLGILLYDQRLHAQKLFTDRSLKTTLAFCTIGLISLSLTVITELSNYPLPNLANNIISLFTIIPLAIITIRLSCLLYNLFSNALFKFMGNISYEIYLIQYFSRIVINQHASSLYLCFLLTALLSWILYIIYKPISKRILNYFISHKSLIN